MMVKVLTLTGTELEVDVEPLDTIQCVKDKLEEREAEAHRLLVKAYDKAVLSERTCCEWFQKFEDGDFGIEDKDRSGRLKTYESTELESLLEKDSSQMQKELALTLEVTQL